MIELRASNNLLMGKDAVLYDVYGKQIAIIPIESENTQIDISNLASGVYVIRINANEGMVMKKFIKK